MKKTIGLIFCLMILSCHAHADANDDAQAGLEALLRGDLATGETLLSQAIDSGELGNQSLVTALARRCAVRLILQQDEAATADCNRAIDLDPNYSSAHMNLAAIYLSQGRYADAIEENDLALQYGGMSRSDTAMAYSNRGLSRVLLGQNEAAIPDFDLAIKLDPKNSFAYNGRALGYIATGDLDKALSDAEAALEIDPAAINPLNTRGLVWLHRRQYDKALADFDAFVELAPENMSGHYNRALVMFLKSDWNAAVASADRSLEILPDLANALYLRGLARRKLGQDDLAQQDIDRAIAINPTVDSVMEGLLDKLQPQ